MPLFYSDIPHTHARTHTCYSTINKTKTPSSLIDMKTHADSDLDLWPLDLMAPVMHCTSTQFGVDSSSHFAFRTQTQTDRYTYTQSQTPLITLPTPRRQNRTTATQWMNGEWRNFSFHLQLFDFLLQLSHKTLLILQLRVQAADLRILPAIETITVMVN